MNFKRPPIVLESIGMIKIECGSLRVTLLPCLGTNYIFILQSLANNKIVVVDPGEFAIVDHFLQAHGLRLDEIWITHHHADHISGVLPLLAKYSCDVRGSLQVPGRIPGVNKEAYEGCHWNYGDYDVTVLALPGHTRDHIAYWMTDGEHSLLFSGDVLFGLGCGRIFEGTYSEMLQSLQKISKLPENTHIFCSHEYTKDNLVFSKWVREGDLALQRRESQLEQKFRQRIPTVPLLLKEELASNLFLRSLSADHPLEEFQLLRDKRNNFRVSN